MYKLVKRFYELCEVRLAFDRHRKKSYAVMRVYDLDFIVGVQFLSRYHL